MDEEDISNITGVVQGPSEWFCPCDSFGRMTTTGLPGVVWLDTVAVDLSFQLQAMSRCGHVCRCQKLTVGGTPYEGGYFRVTFNFGPEYPNVPPKCELC